MVHGTVQWRYLLVPVPYRTHVPIVFFFENITTVVLNTDSFFFKCQETDLKIS